LPSFWDVLPGKLIQLYKLSKECAASILRKKRLQERKRSLMMEAVATQMIVTPVVTAKDLEPGVPFFQFTQCMSVCIIVPF